MADRTPIEWADATALSLARIVPSDKLARTPRLVEPFEGLATPTGALHHRIVLTGKSEIDARLSLDQPMVRNTLDDLKVLKPVIRLAAVDVVDLLTFGQSPADLFLRANPMLIGIAAHVRQVVARKPDQDIAIGSDGTSAAPVWIPLARMNCSHGSPISTGTTQ